MSLTATAPDGSDIFPVVVGNRRSVLAKVTFDSSYPTGGEILSPSMVGLEQIDSVLCNSATSGGRTVVPVLASGVWKLKVLVPGAVTIASHAHVENTDAIYTQSASTAGTVATATAAVAAELANTTNIATETVLVSVTGK